MAWRADRHPRDRRGRFTGLAGGEDMRVRTRNPSGAAVTERVPAPAAHQPGGTPRTMSPQQFDATVPAGRRLYRGAKSSAGAHATISGQLGAGDFGPGIYLGRSIAVAQGYAQQAGADRGGRVLRAAIDPHATVAAPPARVQRAGGTAVAAWAAEHHVDVIDLGNYQVVRNSTVVVFDERSYTLEESVVLDHLAAGYPLDTLPAGYAAAARSLGHHPRGGADR